MKEAIIVINAGSSSLKFKLFGKEQLTVIALGQITGLGTDDPKLIMKDDKANTMVANKLVTTKTRDDLLIDLLNTILELFPDMKIIAAGHRVVHGGNKYNAPTLINNEVIAYLKSIISLTPIHLPHNIRPMEVLQGKFPQIQQVACFDTAFHIATNPMYTRLYALPRAVINDGNVLRYGFHGLSYEYIASVLQQQDEELYKGKVVVCHLGAGASLCALQGGKSFTTTMGFTPLEGLVMGSRTGNIDAGVLLYLLKEKKYSLQEVEDLLYFQSGILGLSEISSDFHTLSNSPDPQAKEALTVFKYNLVKNIGSLIAVMGGIDAIVFTAGVGENDANVRKYVADSLKFLGSFIDETANKANKTVFSKAKSKIKLMIIPTQEELMIAKHSINLLNTK
ncbi:putative propionate kinase [Candidatus Hepatincola sp. Pdp]